MGVKELWSLVTPTGELLPLTALEGKTVAVDLSCWVVDSQALHLGNVTRPHLRNLLFRTVALLNSGVVPVFVLEGDAPSMKWNTISSRNQRNFHTHGSNMSVKTGKRSRFKTILRECGELLDMLGVPWVQAKGEAEATCAALNYHKMVEGVISQDSDVFLYGGHTVFRNFTANQSKATVEKFTMYLLEEHLQLTRGGMILLALLLGCDYFPTGVQGVGKDTAVRLLRMWYQKGVRDPVKRMQSWAKTHGGACQLSRLNSRKWKNGTDEELEAGVRERMLATDGFPFTEIIKEFQNRLDPPSLRVKWRQPQFSDLVSWCIRKLDWEANYAIEKISPIVTRWMVTHQQNLGQLPCIELGLMPVNIVKRCVRRGVASCEIKWKVLNTNLPDGSPSELNTDEPLHLIQSSLPSLLNEFEEANSKKKGKGTRKHIRNGLKKLKGSREKKQIAREELNVPETSVQETDNTEDDLSLIIDRIIGIDLTGKSKRSGQKSLSVEMKQKDKCYEVISDEEALSVSQEKTYKDNDGNEKCLISQSSQARRSKDNITTFGDTSDEEDKENQPVSLRDRITKRIAAKISTTEKKVSQKIHHMHVQVKSSDRRIEENLDDGSSGNKNLKQNVFPRSQTKKEDQKPINIDLQKNGSERRVTNLSILSSDSEDNDENFKDLKIQSLLKNQDSNIIIKQSDSGRKEKLSCKCFGPLSNGSLCNNQCPGKQDIEKRHNCFEKSSGFYKERNLEGGTAEEEKQVSSTKALSRNNDIATSGDRKEVGKENQTGRLKECSTRTASNLHDTDQKVPLEIHMNLQPQNTETKAKIQPADDRIPGCSVKQSKVQDQFSIGKMPRDQQTIDCHKSEQEEKPVSLNLSSESVYKYKEIQSPIGVRENSNVLQGNFIKGKNENSPSGVTSPLSEASLSRNQYSKDMFEDTNASQGLSQFSLPDINSLSLVNCDLAQKNEEHVNNEVSSVTPTCSLQRFKPNLSVSDHTGTPNSIRTPGDNVESFDDTVSPLEPLSAKSIHQLQGSHLKRGKFMRLPQGCNSTPLDNTPKSRCKNSSYGLCFKLLDSFSFTEVTESSKCSEMQNSHHISSNVGNSPVLLQDKPNKTNVNGCINRGGNMNMEKSQNVPSKEHKDRYICEKLSNLCKDERRPVATREGSYERTNNYGNQKQAVMERKIQLANDTFSPVISGLSLAERLKRKCKDKAIDKLLDNL